MKKILAILFVLLICAPAAFADGDGYWTTNEDPYYHIDPACRGAEGMLPISMEGAAEFDKFPCPICRPESINVCGPAWCADPTTYNSQMDAYKDGRAVLMGDTVYLAEAYGWDVSGEVLMRMDAYGDSSTEEIACNLPDGVSIAGKHGIFAYENDILYLDYNTGNVHRLEPDRGIDYVLFTTKEAFPPFLLLVGDRFYSAEGKTVGYYSIPDGSFTPLCKLDIQKAWDWSVVYAEGKLIVMVYAERDAFVSIDTVTGEIIDLSEPFASVNSNIYGFLAIHGRIYAGGEGNKLISANYDGTDVQTSATVHEDSLYSFRRAYDRYVFVVDSKYLPGEYIFISQKSGELRFEPTEMQRAIGTNTPMYFLGDRVYIEGLETDDYIEMGDAKVFLYNSYDLKEYVARQLANPPEERENDGW